MFSIALAVFMALSVWWLSTGAILFLDGLGPRTFRRTFAGASVLLAAALWEIVRLRNDTHLAAAYLGFACAICVWAWIELSFLLGFLTGPRRKSCPAGCAGIGHMWHAIEAILYHELSIVALAVLVYVISWNASNHVAAAAITVLWLMRASAKLNLFLGVRNSGAELLPRHLAYLQGFFRRSPMNFLFPFSVTAATVALAALIQRIWAPGAGEFSSTSCALLASLTALGLLEHWMLVLPFRASALWSWSLRSRVAPV
jgi:putative photosynthetic complex assembly protein 2